jgi:serine/threonine protein kinase
VSLEPTNLQERYELREILGRGGMGVVYRAIDTLMKREVALKTILDIENPATLQLFYKEWSILATMVHPNVINIYDIGEFDQDGAKKPFFVMPLLPGVTLDRLIKDGSPRLSVPGVLEIITQAAHGLHAAHEQGLIHRDVKPSNIFVMDDNSVKIIDFGIARQASVHSKTTLKGTLYYLAPEQLEMKPPSALSDLFALGVVTYEALTRRRPFQGATESEVVESILHHSPPPVSELNRDVGYSISQVVHKAMAKQPWHRFYNMREFADALQKALRNEPLEYFDATKTKPRLERAAKSFEAGDYTFASEVLSELDAEGHLDQEIARLRGQVDQAVRQTRIRQMLESARRFFDATEYSLALRKIQEAIELDPTDPDALSLKAQVEKDRREKKISEWIALARQHLDNQAFRQARDALDNVIQIKPNETEALSLMEEIGRRESEVSRSRDEKARLYQAACQAWEKGEVTSALSKLEVLVAMDRDLPESDTGRSSTYQNFYNQVSSEHNALKNSYEEAKRNLAGGNFEAASATCKQFLAKYPNHALFQALKFDVEERQRQKLSQVIAETDRKVEEEADLDRRMGILEEALKLYPGENHLERAVRLVRDKRDLVNSIVSKARFYEDRGQFNEALDQWQILKSIHDKQPGLPFEIQRLVKRRDQQARETAKARWVEQSDQYLEGGDYKRALQTVQAALAEFPGESELLELEKLVRKSQERGHQALGLLARAREAGEKGATEEALASLREASSLDSRNTVIRTVLVNSLLDQARRLVDTDWDSAGGFVQEVLQLEPNHAPAQSLAARIADRKREGFVAWCLAQARRMQTDGEIDGALGVVAQGLGTYPNEQRLQQLQATLLRAQAEKQRQTGRPREVRDAPTVIPVTDPAAAAASPKPPAENAADGKTPAPPAPEPSGDLTVAFPAPVAATPVPAPPPVAGDALAAAAPPPVPERTTARTPPPPRGPSGINRLTPWFSNAGQEKRLYIITATAVAVILLIAAIVGLSHQKKPAPVPAATKFQVVLRSTPEGAEIKFNGDTCGTSVCRMQLARGTYQATARLSGYQDASISFTVDQGVSPEVNLPLAPLPPHVALVTDLTEGTVQLDGAPAGQIQDGGVEVANLAPGKHTLTVESGTSTASVQLEIVPGAMPRISAPVESSNLRGFVLTGYGAGARLYGSATGFRASLDGQPSGDLPPDGLALQNLASGTHELQLDGPNREQDKMVFESQPSAALYISLRTARNLGTVNLVANEDEAELYINGEKYRRTTKRGRLILYLTPRKYTLHLQKDGFAPTPDQTVDVQKGQEARLTFNLLPAKSTLAVHHAPPNTEVSVDGAHTGSVRSDGEFSISTLDPGHHTVSLRHDGFKPLQTDVTLAGGKTLDLQGALESTLGTLKIEISPAGIDARLRIRHEGESQDHDVTGNSQVLAEGTYTVTGSAPQYQNAAVTVHVTANAVATARIDFKKADAPAAKSAANTPPAASAFGMDDWIKAGGWVRQDRMIVHQGGDYVVAPPILSQGSVRFSAVILKGKRLEWVLAFRDNKNYLFFQLDDKNLTRYEISNGNKASQQKFPHKLDRKQFLNISVSITPVSVVTSVQQEGQWVVLDTWSIPGGPHGKFGFHIPSSDQIGLTDFQLIGN